MMEPETRPAAPPGPDYLIETSTDPEGIEAIAQELTSKAFMISYLIIGIALMIVGAFLYMLHMSTQAILTWIVGGTALYLRATSAKRLARMQNDRLEQRYGQAVIPIRMVFWPQGVAVQNRLSLGQSNFRYETITRLRRYGDYLYFRDQQGRWALLRMEDTVGLTGFLDYFKSKCVNAKVKV